ncbi:Elongator subunit elp4 [Umbelopsis sp. WA50703]
MSFKKRTTANAPKLPAGSRISAYNGQLLISTGVPSLDDILGGGLPVGTMLLIQEDPHTSYAQLLLSYFLAQGVACGHHCAIASVDESPRQILENLPWLADENKSGKEDEKESKQESENDKMSIAWRYQSLKRFDSGVTPRSTPAPISQPNKQAGAGPPEVNFCDTFDLTSKIKPEALDKAKSTLISPPTCFDDNYDSNHDDYDILMKDLQSVIVDGGFSSLVPAPPGGERNALRIGIQSLASPNWQSKNPEDVLKVLLALRGLLRFSFGAAVITIPSYLYDAAFQRRLQHLCDAVVEIESFAGSISHSAASYAQTYHGFFHVHKVPVLNSLLPSSTKLSVLSADGSNNLGFKLRRKRFAIETFHLPPEGGVSTRRTTPSEASEEKSSKAEGKSSGDSKGRLVSSLASLSMDRSTPVGCGSTPRHKDPLEF